MTPETYNVELAARGLFDRAYLVCMMLVAALAALVLGRVGFTLRSGRCAEVRVSIQTETE
jgi:hypothetical protein